MKRDDRSLSGDGCRAHDQTRQVYGQETRAVEGVRGAVGQRGDGQGRHRVQTGRGEPRSTKRVGGAGPHEHSDHQADPELSDE